MRGPLFARQPFLTVPKSKAISIVLILVNCNKSASFFQVSMKIGISHELDHVPIALDSLLIPKVSKPHIFQDIKNSFHVAARMGLEPQQNFFQKFFSTNMVTRGVQSFCILEGAADSLIRQ